LKHDQKSPIVRTFEGGVSRHTVEPELSGPAVETLTSRAIERAIAGLEDFSDVEMSRARSSSEIGSRFRGNYPEPVQPGGWNHKRTNEMERPTACNDRRSQEFTSNA